MTTSPFAAKFHRFLIVAVTLATLSMTARADDQIERKDQSLAAHQQTFNTLKERGYVPIYVKAYMVNGQVRIDTVYDKNDGCSWEMRIGMSPAAFFQLDQDLKDAGYKRVSHNSHTFGPNVFHAAIWHKKN